MVKSLQVCEADLVSSNWITKAYVFMTKTGRSSDSAGRSPGAICPRMYSP